MRSSYRNAAAFQDSFCSLRDEREGGGHNGVLTLCYVLLFLCFCNALFLTKQCFKGLHYNVEIHLTGKGKVDTFLCKGIHSYASTKFFGLSNSSARQVKVSKTFRIFV